jgi:hypothetical protein
MATIVAPEVLAAAADDRAVLAALTNMLARGEAVRLVSGAVSVELPASLVQLFAQCVEALALDRPALLLPPQTTLSLAEAADLLNVPRVNAHRLLSEAELPVIEGEGEPRIRADHLLAYRARRAGERRWALAELVAAGQELDPDPPTG